MAIRVVLIEDHALVAGAMAAALRTVDDLEVSGLAETFDDALELLARQEPDVALVDLTLGDRAVVDDLHVLRAASSRTRLLVVTAWATEQSADRALAEGASGLVSKTQPLAELVDGIRRVHAGELVVCPHVLAAMVRRATAPTAAPGPDRREVEVLELLAEARSTREIARTLCMSEHTVRNRIRSSMAKLGTHNRTATVAEATRRGWLVPRAPSPA